MSYDIRIWSIKRAELSEIFPSQDDWKIQNNSAYYQKKDWQIIVSESAKVENEDIEDDVSSLLSGIKYVTDITLEPIHAPETARALLDKVAKNIAKNSVGVVENLQDDTFSLPTGIKKFIPIKRENKQRFSIFEMSWWFNDSPAVTEDLLEHVVDYFESKLPEALPRRYGLYEPPQFKYEENGKQHFLQFLKEHIFDLGIVWYPTKPVMYVSTGFIKEWGFIKHGAKNKFKTNNFSISFDSSLLSQPGWKEHLANVFEDMSKILQPFYGEVRTLHNFISGKGTYFSDMQTESHPVQGPWWTGIPQELGQAIVLGKPYLDLWQQIKEKGEVKNDLCFISTLDWEREESVSSFVGSVPKDLAQLKIPKYVEVLGGGKTMDYNDEYPANFPFKKKVEK